MKISFSFLFLALASVTMFAQPANDDCANAVALTVAADRASCPVVEGTTTDATFSASPTDICAVQGDRLPDDVWYSLDVVSVTNGLTIELDFGGEGQLDGAGLAIYTSCADATETLQCFNENNLINNKIFIPQCDLGSVSDLLVRVWGGQSTANAIGTFNICAYNGSPADYYYHETFGDGLAGWNAYGWCMFESTANPLNPLFAWREVADGNLFPNGPGSTPFNRLSDAPTACDGAVAIETRNSDCGRGSVGYLESPWISTDSFSDDVALLFEQDVAFSLGTYFVEYRTSLDTNWQRLSSDINFGFIPSSAIRTDYREAIHDISNIDSIQVRFLSVMNDFYWMIDDVRFENLEENNMRINENFHVVQPRSTPKSQFTPVGFLADIYNMGSNDVDGVQLLATVFDENGELVYLDSLDYGLIAADSLAENVNFSNTFTPDDEEDFYTGQYILRSDATDANLDDNVIQFGFAASDSTFAHEFFPFANGDIGDFYIGLQNASANAPLPSYTTGNIFYTPNGGGQQFSTATFSVTNPESLVGSGVVVALYRWENTNNDSTIQESERTLEGAFYQEFTAAHGPNQLFNVKLENINSANQDDPIALQDDAVYLLGLEYTASSADAPMFIPTANDLIDYGAYVFRSQQIGEPTYVTYTVSSDFGDPLSLLDFEPNDIFGGHAAIPLIQMNIQPLSTSTEELSSNNNINLFPNPAVNTITLDLELEKVFDVVEVQITDVAGKVVFSNSIENVQNKRVVYNLDTFTSGVYILKMNTQEGVKNLKFVVQK